MKKDEAILTDNLGEIKPSDVCCVCKLKRKVYGIDKCADCLKR